MAPHVDSAGARAPSWTSAALRRAASAASVRSRNTTRSRAARALDDAIYVIVQIEGRAGIERIADIAAVPGIDAVFVGPYDLAMSLGVAPGSPRVFAAAQRLADSVAQGPASASISTTRRTAAWAARRFALQVVSFDGRMLADAARATAARAGGGR